MSVEDHAGGVHEQREREFVDRWPWLLPLAAGIFLGAAVFEMLPQAIMDAGASAWGWLLAGVALFVAGERASTTSAGTAWPGQPRSGSGPTPSSRAP